MTRTIDAPGIQLNEIDRSQYNKSIDNSLPNSPYSFIMGFADNGEDYSVKWINSKNTLVNTYGYPTNEAEKYFYNACLEVLNSGGKCIASKLPYDNNSFEQYAYTTYKVDNRNADIQSPYQIATEQIYSSSINKSLALLLFMPDIDIDTINLIIHEDRSTAVLLDNIAGATTLTQYLYDETINNLKNLLAIYDKNGIQLTAITDIVNDIITKCELNLQNTTVAKLCFYRSNNVLNALNDGLYRLQYLYDNTVAAFITKYDTEDHVLFLNTESITSIQQILKNINRQREFMEFVTSYAKTCSIEYYNDRFTSLKNAHAADSDENIFLNNVYNSFVNTNMLTENTYSNICNIDNSIRKIRFIRNSDESFSSTMMSADIYNLYQTSLKPIPNNTFIIVDKTRQKYQQIDLLSGDTVIRDQDILGILPVITTASNALLALGLLKRTTLTLNGFSPLAKVKLILTQAAESSGSSKINIEDLNYDILLSSNDIYLTTMSDNASSLFPAIDYSTSSLLDRKHLKDVGVVVYKLEKTLGTDNRITLELLESFVGSFDKNETDSITHASRFIDRIVNDNSLYINMFSNVILDKETDIFNIQKQTSTSLGFFKEDTVKNISYTKSILQAITKVLDKIKDPNQLPIDIIIDAGVSNIAQYLMNVYPSADSSKRYVGKYDLISDNSYLFQLNSVEDTTAWKNVISKIDIFCSKTRKDCMFIADGLRTFCLNGNNKIVNNDMINLTFNNKLLPKLKYMIGLNTSYSAGYCNWYKTYDSYSGDYFWCPPSIKAAAIYSYTDSYWHKWDAPAGLNRGKVNAIDVAFNPTNDEAGKLYLQAWNYAVSYPLAGIIIEGQKTFQRRSTAFDRINVRRLFLYLEKEVIRIAKYFFYEGNTQFIRQKFVDTISPLFEDAINGNGIDSYLIKCDETNNTPTTIDRNELHCTIAVRPVKSIEYICLNFICTNLSMSLIEEIENIN